MGIKALQTGTVHTHVSKYDKRPAEGEPGHDEFVPTTWKYRTLDSRVLGLLKDKTTKIGIDPSKPDEEITTTVAQNAYNFDVCAFGLDKPDNFTVDGTPDGAPVPWKTVSRNFGGKSYEVVSPETLGMIPDAIIVELSEKITETNSLSPEAGNGSTSQS